MRPPLSVTGTRWTRWTPLSNLSRANTPWPVTEAIASLKPPSSAALAEISLEAPALGLGIALVHAKQVAGEQRRLVAAGAGADLEHRRALVGGVARKQLQREVALGLGQRRLILGQLLGRHLREAPRPPHGSSARARPTSSRSRRTSFAAAATGSTSA